MSPNEAGTASETLKASRTAVSVLVIDDDDDIRLLLHELLKAEGYSVAAASNGREALDLLRTVTPCMILLDLAMPVMDGAQFRELQLQDDALAVIPTIVMTAYDRAREKAAPLLVAECLEKPLDFDQLLRLVEHYCRE